MNGLLTLGSVEPHVSDVAVIGAGPAGLAAARALAKAGKSVTVLEARDRVGGRTWSDTIDGAFLEIGGQWVSPDQTELLGLLEELGKQTYPRHREGSSVYLAPEGRRHVYHGDIFPVPESTAAEIARLTTALDELARTMDPEQPWAHERARELDTISFHHWLRQQSQDELACDCVGIFIAGGMLTKPAHAFSALQAVLMAASAGSFSNLTDEDFILDRRVVGGMQSVSSAMATELGHAVVLGSPVRSVEQVTEGVVVVSDGLTVHAQHVVVAVPPPLYSRISFDPPLSRLHHQMHQHQSMGIVIKVHAVYDTPFWRQSGLSGTCFGPGQICQEVYDNTLHDDDAGTLVGFVSDEAADAMFTLTAQQRKERILGSIAAYLGEEVLNPTVYYESDFGSEEWTRGAYAASYDLGGLHRYSAHQREPVGPIHWACSDIAGAGYQHVDGALRQGRRAAEEILTHF